MAVFAKLSSDELIMEAALIVFCHAGILWWPIDLDLIRNFKQIGILIDKEINIDVS